MKNLELNAYAKINLSIDILGTRPDGYHEVAMVMQQIDLCDKIRVQWLPNAADEDGGEEEITVEIGSNKNFLPTDQRNLAYKAAKLIADTYEIHKKVGFGKVRIDIKKQIPVGAGLGGGSADAAAVLHALSAIWGLRLGTDELRKLGACLGADVPFCVMGQAFLNRKKRGYRGRLPDCLSTCALAGGIGTDLTPIKGAAFFVVLSKPPISVSTADVYKGFDSVAADVFERPDTRELLRALKVRDFKSIEKNLVNVLENFTLKAYPIVVCTKRMMAETSPLKALMSGSGPTIIGFYRDKKSAEAAYNKMAAINKETFLSKTLI